MLRVLLPGQYVSGLAFSPFDTNTLYVAFSGYDEGTPGQPGHLFKTTNAFAAHTCVDKCQPAGGFAKRLRSHRSKRWREYFCGNGHGSVELD